MITLLTVDLLNEILNHWYVYLISFDNGKLIKIGSTKNPFIRYKDLKRENRIGKNPDGFIYIYSYDSKKEARMYERQLHKICSKYKYETEFFHKDMLKEFDFETIYNYKKLFLND